jgi:hypothetical protein
MNFTLFGIVGVAAISVICYLVGMGIKVSKIDDKFIPVICGIFGAILGVVGFVIKMPDFPAQDPITAVAVGIVSGLAATGANQIYKQMKGDK